MTAGVTANVPGGVLAIAPRPNYFESTRSSYPPQQTNSTLLRQDQWLERQLEFGQSILLRVYNRIVGGVVPSSLFFTLLPL
jgi:hypothetical protein